MEKEPKFEKPKTKEKPEKEKILDLNVDLELSKEDFENGNTWKMRLKAP